MLKNSFKDYKENAHKWITFMDSEYYPDYLDAAQVLYGNVLQEFIKLVNSATDSINLLVLISNKTSVERIQLLRIFRKYVSPDTSVEMLK